MDVIEAIAKRRSIRKYKSSTIPKEHLKKILASARLAPSAGNRQPWRFMMVRSPKRKMQLAKASQNQMFFADAAVVVVALADQESSPKWFKQDVMIAIEHMALVSLSLGYGTCWIGAFDEMQVKQLLKIPERLAVVALLPVGVPDEYPQPRPRKGFDEIFFAEEEYGEKLIL